MAHQIDSMMFVGATPWHGLGTFVGNSEITSDEAIVKAGLDWAVERQNVYATDLTDPAKSVLVPGYKHIRRMDNGKVLSIMGEGYRPVQNKGKFSFFDEVVGEKLAMYHTAMSLDEGRKVALLAKIPGEIRIEGVKDDVTEKYLLLADSFDGSVAFTMMVTPVRVVCANTLNMALRQGAKTAFKLRHSVNIENRVDEARKALGIANRQFEIFEEEANILAKTKFTDDQMKKLAAELFPSTEEDAVSTRIAVSRTKVLDLFENGRGHGPIRGTAWAALNSIGEFADHHRGTRKTNGKSEDEARTTSILFGDAQKLKQRAANFIYQQIAA